jgi:hypothetical protein
MTLRLRTFAIAVCCTMTFAALQLLGPSTARASADSNACCVNTGTCPDGEACCPICPPWRDCSSNYYGRCMDADSACCSVIQ